MSNDDNRMDVPVRFRISRAEAQRFQQAAAQLGIETMSTFYRWALENSATMVLGQPVAAPKPQPAPRPQRRAPKVVVTTPPPVEEVPMFEVVSAPVPYAPAPSAPTAPQQQLSALLGLPLYGTDSIRPMPFDDEDDA